MAQSKIIIVGDYRECVRILSDRDVKLRDAVIVTPSSPSSVVRGYTGPFEVIWTQRLGGFSVSHLHHVRGEIEREQAISDLIHAGN